MVALKKVVGEIYKSIFTQKALDRMLQICEANDPFSDMTRYETFKGIYKFRRNGKNLSIQKNIVT